MLERPLTRIHIRPFLKHIDTISSPPIVEQLLAAFSAPVDSGQLAEIISQDKALASQILHLANSPYYRFRGKTEELIVVIDSVLGYEMVLHMAIGFAVLESFHVREHSAISEEMIRYHSLECGILCDQLARLIDEQGGKIERYRAFLAGLLHDVGFLVLGQIYPQAYVTLTELITELPMTTLALEDQVMDVSHCELGGRLMKQWGFPEEIVVACQEHHNPHEGIEGINYALLIHLAEQLLGFDRNESETEEDVLQRVGDQLGLPQEILGWVMANVISRDDQMAELAKLMS